MTQLTQRVAARHRLRRSKNKKDPLRPKHGYNDRLRSELERGGIRLRIRINQRYMHYQSYTRRKLNHRSNGSTRERAPQDQASLLLPLC